MKDFLNTHSGIIPGMPAPFRLSTGTLELEIDARDRGDLFLLAERQNPKRAFLFVSTVLGRHIPVSPAEHRRALRDLSRKASEHLLGGPVFVMGYAETAVGIGAGVFDCLRAEHPGLAMGYLHTTRHPFPGQASWFTMVEGHSHATDHHIMTPGPDVCAQGPGATLVLVDDETTTGNTFAQLAGGLFEAGARFERVVLVTLTDWSDGEAARRVSAASGGADVVSVSLVSGRWSWSPDPDAEIPELPGARPAECPRWQPDPRARYRSPRDGLRGSEMGDGGALLRDLRLPAFESSESVLVIGSGEHVWMPFLCAEAIERQGHETGFVATTRSPILPGPVIERKIAFPDHFGLGIEMYLHNVNPKAWDRIVLFTETGPEGVPAQLRRALGKGHVVDALGRVSAMLDA